MLTKVVIINYLTLHLQEEMNLSSQIYFYDQLFEGHAPDNTICMRLNRLLYFHLKLNCFLSPLKTFIFSYPIYQDVYLAILHICYGQDVTQGQFFNQACIQFTFS